MPWLHRHNWLADEEVSGTLTDAPYEISSSLASAWLPSSSSFFFFFCKKIQSISQSQIHSLVVLSHTEIVPGTVRFDAANTCEIQNETCIQYVGYFIYFDKNPVSF